MHAPMKCGAHRHLTPQSGATPPCKITLKGPARPAPPLQVPQSPAIPNCPSCEGNKTLFCYVGCKCGLKPVEVGGTAKTMAALTKGPTGDQSCVCYPKSCVCYPQSCQSKRFPEACDPSCQCGCKKSGKIIKFGTVITVRNN